MKCHKEQELKIMEEFKKKKPEWYVEFNDGDSFGYSTEELYKFLQSNKPQQLQDYKIKDTRKIINTAHYPFADTGCCICKSEKDLFTYDDTAYCREHYIQLLQARLRYAKKEINADSLANFLPKMGKES